ncbi:PREDICTED: E3 ubiquitin-protein ligase MSL2-like, partial [Amphimedon queenslandica]|uniref:RING-type domain-containing protein n=2 Tax=Amphimedon queenslandica TaxID=400682 RepID=A0AAN0J6S7_AMPQE
MPLPKSASIGARATDVYSESCPLVMNYIKERGGGGEGELPQLLPYLRQLLTCCACAGLLRDPMVSLSCGHCYCYECQFVEPLLKIHCRQCRGREGLVINNQLRLVASLYRELIRLLGLATPTDHALQELVLEVTEGVKVSKGLFYILPPTRYRKLTSLKPLKSKSRETSSSICADPISDDDANITDFDIDADLCVNEDCIRAEALTSADRSSHFKIMRDSNKTVSSSSSSPL